ncbi:MAG: hypothetical protein IJ735_02920 [Clostridia bacterium]|nr:hypothetical protein [Clostridia bacterium]
MKDRRKRFVTLPVEHVEVNHKHVGLRLFFFIFFVAVAIVGIALGVYFLTRSESGWETVTVRSSAMNNCGGDFGFYYYFEGTSTQNRSAYRAVQDKYTELCVTAYREFSPYEDFSDVKNVRYINAHPNEEIVVDEVLYKAFEKSAWSRFLYGAPVWQAYESLCASSDDWTAELYDGALNAEAAAYYAEVLSFASDPDSVDLELLGDNKLILHVSPTYLAYAQENGVESFVDFAYWKNAFIIDALVEGLRAAGFGAGFLTSYDGYTRTLTDQHCTFPLFAKIDDSFVHEGVAQLGKNFSSVALHSFITRGMDDEMHYLYADGHYAHVYVDPTDAVSKCATDCFIVYSPEKSCADLLPYVYPLWIADSFDSSALSSYSSAGLFYVYTDGPTAHYSDPDLVVTMIDDGQWTFRSILD